VCKTFFPPIKSRRVRPERWRSHESACIISWRPRKDLLHPLLISVNGSSFLVRYENLLSATSLPPRPFSCDGNRFFFFRSQAGRKRTLYPVMRLAGFFFFPVAPSPHDKVCFSEATKFSFSGTRVYSFASHASFSRRNLLFFPLEEPPRITLLLSLPILPSFLHTPPLPAFTAPFPCTPLRQKAPSTHPSPPYACYSQGFAWNAHPPPSPEKHPSRRTNVCAPATGLFISPLSPVFFPLVTTKGASPTSGRFFFPPREKPSFLTGFFLRPSINPSFFPLSLAGQQAFFRAK